MYDALRASEWDAAVEIGASWFGSDESLQEGATLIRSELDAWKNDDYEAGLRLLEPLANGRLPGWQDVLDPLTRARAHRLAAWVSLRRLNDVDTARKHLDQAVDLVPYDGVSYAELAALSLSQGLLDRAATHARRAIELAPADPAGYLQLGCWAELSGLFEDAADLYRQAIQRMPLQVVATISQRSTLFDAPGALPRKYVAPAVSITDMNVMMTIAVARRRAPRRSPRPRRRFQ